MDQCCCRAEAEVCFSQYYLGSQLRRCSRHACCFHVQEGRQGQVKYSFESEWKIKGQCVDVKAGTICVGVVSSSARALYQDNRLWGPVSHELVSPLVQIGKPEDAGFPGLHRMLRGRLAGAEGGQSTSTIKTECTKLGVKMYVSQGNCVRSLFCLGTTSGGNVCLCCTAVSRNATFKKRTAEKGKALA